MQFSDHLYILYGLKPQSANASLEILYPLIHPMDKPVVQKAIEGLKQEAKELDHNYRIVRPDGKTRYFRNRCQPLVSAEGQTLIIGTTQDITEDILLNQQLRERIRFAEMLSENILDKVMITNTSNILIGWNSKSEEAYGLTKEEVIGKNIFDVFPKLKKPEIIE